MNPTLWERIREGDSAAFSELFDDYADLIYNVAFRRTGSWEAAEEIVSMVFLEAWRQRATVTDQAGTIRPWLLGVALNLIRRHWRQTDRHRRATLRLAPDPTQGDHAADVSDRLDAEETMRRVLRRLEQLPEDQREVVQLWAWEELSYDEIAVVLDTPVGTVKSRLHRARAALLEAMDSHRAANPPEPDQTQAFARPHVQGGTTR